MPPRRAASRAALALGLLMVAGCASVGVRPIAGSDPADRIFQLTGSSMQALELEALRLCAGRQPEWLARAEQQLPGPASPHAGAVEFLRSVARNPTAPVASHAQGTVRCGTALASRRPAEGGAFPANTSAAELAAATPQGLGQGEAVAPVAQAHAVAPPAAAAHASLKKTAEAKRATTGVRAARPAAPRRPVAKAAKASGTAASAPGCACEAPKTAARRLLDPA